MDERLNQIDLEELSAYMDGELTDSALSRVEDLLRTSPAWRRALEQLQAVDRAMEAYVAPAAPPDLAQRVLRKTSHAHRVVALSRPSLRWVVPLTAAAAIVVAVLVYGALSRPVKHRGAAMPPVAQPQTPPVGGQVTTPAPGPDNDENAYPEVAGDNFVEDHLDFFRDISVVNELDTIEAIYNQQQTRGGGT